MTALERTALSLCLALGAAALGPARVALAQDAGGADAAASDGGASDGGTLDGAALDGASEADGGAHDASASGDAATPDGGDADGGTGCPADAVGCASAPIAYRRSDGLPLEFDVDTGWVPRDSPVQLRFRAALAGRTTVRAAGALEAAWPRPMVLRARGTPGAGHFAMDYGIVLVARLRGHFETDRGTYDWEGDIPYVPRVDFRATASETFDPWAWEGVWARGRTARQRLGDIPLTESIIPIPGIEGGLSFDAQADLAGFYRSLQIAFGPPADPITARTERVMGLFTAGPQVEYFPRLEGQVEYSGTLRVYPSLYIRLYGRRWMFTLAEVPVTFGPRARDWPFDPSPATLLLPDVARREVAVDFGEVAVGEAARDAVPFESIGRVPLWVGAPEADAAPFAFPRGEATIAPRTTVALPVEFRPQAPGPVEQRVAFRTSDPDTPTLWVALRGTGVMADAGAASDVVARADTAPSSADGGDPGAHAGGCGCRVGGARAGAPRAAWLAALLAAVSLALGRRRRRAGRHRPASSCTRYCTSGASTKSTM